MHFTQQQGTSIHLPEVESRCEGGLLSLFLHPLQYLDHLSYKILWYTNWENNSDCGNKGQRFRESPDHSSQQWEGRVDTWWTQPPARIRAPWHCLQSPKVWGLSVPLLCREGPPCPTDGRGGRGGRVGKDPEPRVLRREERREYGERRDAPTEVDLLLKVESSSPPEAMDPCVCHIVIVNMCLNTKFKSHKLSCWVNIQYQKQLGLQKKETWVLLEIKPLKIPHRHLRWRFSCECSPLPIQYKEAWSSTSEDRLK